MKKYIIEIIIVLSIYAGIPTFFLSISQASHMEKFLGIFLVVSGCVIPLTITLLADKGRT